MCNIGINFDTDYISVQHACPFGLTTVIEALHFVFTDARGLDAVLYGNGQNRLALPISSEAKIMGWGAQDERNYFTPSSKLRSLSVATIDCPDPFGYDEHGDEHFICIAAPPDVGGPCRGDEGGVRLCNNLRMLAYLAMVAAVYHILLRMSFEAISTLCIRCKSDNDLCASPGHLRILSFPTNYDPTYNGRDASTTIVRGIYVHRKEYNCLGDGVVHVYLNVAAPM